MIRVHKDLDVVPLSLNERKTEKRRDSCIRDRKYHQKKEFHQRFKQKDVKEALNKIYNQKCAFCEEKVEECINNRLEDCSSTVEHYRPKSTYYWLAYSWDNLLWCCHRCNQNKSNSFEILKTKIVYLEEFLENIHNSSEEYQAIENPKVIHPEYESVLDKLCFKNGEITSDDERVKYTIKTCGLDRDDLNDKRKTILKSFINKLEDRVLKKKAYSDIVNSLKQDFMNKKSEFRALKFWILKNHKSLVEDS